MSNNFCQLRGNIISINYNTYNYQQLITQPDLILEICMFQHQQYTTTIVQDFQSTVKE